MSWDNISPWRPISGAGQNLTIGATSVPSTAFSGGAQAVSVSAIGGNCHIALGTVPVAVATDMLIKQSDPPIILRVGLGEKIAVIQDGSSTGTLNLIPMTH